jgi:short-subunit dehydrogenase
MKKQKEGSIVNISSGTALMTLPSMSPYSSLKRAVVGISLTAREELKEFGINVSVVYPYITKTDFEKNTLKSGGQNWEDNGDGPPMPGDPPEYIAKKILEAIETEKPEVFAHDWMGKRE